MILHIKDIKKGQTFYESESGFDTEFVALEDGHFDGKYWILKARDSNGRKVKLGFMEGFDAYAPKLYTVPQYYN